MNELLSNLNQEQQKAVQTIYGPVLVVAGAGSGKTRTLTHRVAYLIKKEKISPSNILAVTFTNKAAKEMRARIAELLNISPPNNSFQNNYAFPHLGTFHSVCVRLLRQEIENLGYSKTFNILDDQDQLTLIKKIFKELSLNKEQFNPRSILATISKAKNNLLEVEDFSSQANGFYEEIVSKIFSLYQKNLLKSQSLDFDDLLFFTVKLLRQYPNILEKYQKTFQYILVDEYQDTNHAQYTLIKLLAQKHQNIFAVGDDWQAIYGWRQADIRNILNFEKDFPQAKIIKLEQNYRSTQIILDSANQIIAQNINQKKKKIWTKEKKGELITLYTAQDENDEANFISQIIQEKIKKEKNIDYNHFAILYRTNAQSRALEESFLKYGLPYRIIGGIKFYQRQEIKDIIAYLRFIQNNSDLMALERIINQPKRGIGKKTLEKWLQLSSTLQKNPCQLVLDNDYLKLKIPSVKKRILYQFSELIFQSKQMAEKISLDDFIKQVVQKTGYQSFLKNLGDEGETRWENIQELFSVAKKYKNNPASLVLDSFLEEVALATDTDNIAEDQPVIHLMTLHSAKGLEFPVVFITGVEESILPHSRSLLSEKELEEERRLMYVGITRAQKKVYLTHTEFRNIFGSIQNNAPSRFLEEISPNLIEKLSFNQNNLNKTKKKETSAKNQKNFLKNKVQFKDGDYVLHPQFGKGLIVATQNDIANIAFSQQGIKKLSLKYAPLKKI